MFMCIYTNKFPALMARLSILVSLSLLVFAVTGLAEPVETKSEQAAPDTKEISGELELNFDQSVESEGEGASPIVRERAEQTDNSMPSLDLSLPEKLYSDENPLEENVNSTVAPPLIFNNLFEQKKNKESGLSITGKPLFREVDGPITRDNLIDQVDGASVNVELKN